MLGLLNLEFESFSQFCQWYYNLVPAEPLDLQEAALIYFNLEIYKS